MAIHPLCCAVCKRHRLGSELEITTTTSAAPNMFIIHISKVAKG